MKVYDSFIFFNELDLLELRFNILNDYVDYFVIVESEITFQGDIKELYFDLNKDRFKKFAHKIIHLKVLKYDLNFSCLPYTKNPQNIDESILNMIYGFLDKCPHFDKKIQFWWGNDFFQRECILRALAMEKPQDNDLILISDVDEIPDPKAIEIIRNTIKDRSIFAFKQHEFCYYLNYFHNSEWVGPCAFLYGPYKNTSLNSIRFATKRDEDGLNPEIIENGGWHFTSLGSFEVIKKKIKSWGHKELNVPLVLNAVEYNVKHGYDIFRRPDFGRLTCLSIADRLFPQYLTEHATKYQNLIGGPILKENIFQWFYYSIFMILRSRFISIINTIRG
jgi:beta-1,4-mannosyl-glycoprotein beta-1,4-N-acetylglucosaminyltransferase